MADTITEFYNSDSITYSTLDAGLTVATTSGSEKAVIRDINIEVPGGLPVDVKVDGVKVAESSGKSSTLTGHLLLKASQTVKLSPKTQPLWTGLQANYYVQDSNDSSAKRTYNDLSSSNFWAVPVDRVKINARDDRNIRPAGGKVTALESVITTGDKITIWPADALFNKPANDFYYSSYMLNATETAGQNKLCYYDSSADTASQVQAAFSDYVGWDSGFSNRFLVSYKDDGTGYKYFDTTNNSLSSAISYTEANTGTAHTITRDWDVRQTSIIDHYMLEKPHQTGAQCRAYLTDLLTGKTVYWTSVDDNINTIMLPRNSSGQANWSAGAALARNTGGEWFILWNFTRSNTYAQNEHNYGIRVISLGSDLSTYFTQSQVENPNGATLKCGWLPNNGTAPDSVLDQECFRLHDGATRYGWGTGFCALTKPTPTYGYTSRYWMHCMHSGCFLIDLDNVTSNGADFMEGVRWTEGSTNTNGWPQGYVEDFTWCPTWDQDRISGAYGTVKARVTGIKET